MAKVLTGLDSHRRITEIIHGDGPGADLLADSIGRTELGTGQDRPVIHRFPALWSLHGKSAGPIRNQQMANLKPDLCLAFIDRGLQRSRGTLDMVSRAHQAGIFTRVIEAVDGRVVVLAPDLVKQVLGMGIRRLPSPELPSRMLGGFRLSWEE
jgi:hypothetical protein